MRYHVDMASRRCAERFAVASFGRFEGAREGSLYVDFFNIGHGHLPDVGIDASSEAGCVVSRAGLDAKPLYGAAGCLLAPTLPCRAGPLSARSEDHQTVGFSCGVCLLEAG
jgi:hypothetical protein